MVESGGNPESMKSTKASTITIVREANEIVYQAARNIANKGTEKTEFANLAERAILFIKGGL